MGRRRMKTNGDEKETHLAETTATYALGVFCQLVNPYISGVDHHKKGFMKDFFDAVLEDDGLRNPLPQHHRNRKPGKTTITTGVWSGINDTDLTRFYNGRKKIPAWKAAEFYQRLDISKVERLCCDISIDALADFQKELIKANIRVTDISELPSATGKWLLSILQANAGGRDILIDGISFQPKFDIFENLPLASGRINNGKLHLGRSSVPWKAYPIPPDKPDDHLEKGLSLFGVGEWVGGWWCWSGSLGGMDTTSLFTAALQLPDPWRVSGVEFRDEEDGRRELHIAIGFAAGSRFPCPEPGCGEAACPVHDARERVWRHLNFFQYKAFIHAGVPRVTCPAHGVHAVPVPWARPGSGFTLLFEAMVVELAKSQPVADIAEQVGEHDTRLWRFIRHYVDEARLYEDYTGVEAIGIDETSRKGHRYITVVADLVERNVICVVPGKDSTTIKRFARDFMDHNGDPDRVRLVTCDMSLGFAKGIRERLPNAARIIDKFHVIKHANEAVDKVRKQEARGNALLKRTKYLWLRNESNLTGLQLETKRSLQRRRLKTGRACQMRETLQDIYDTSADRAEAETALKRLCSWMTRSRLEPMKEFARQIRRHWRDILAYFDHPYTNAILEGLNSVIQNVKTRARGFKNMGYFSTMIYLTCGKLDLSTVTT